MKKPKIIFFCGPIRFAKEEFNSLEYETVLNGNIALLPYCQFHYIQRKYTDADQRRKIDICDEVYIVNVNGSINDRTRAAILYAQSLNKPIFYLIS